MLSARVLCLISLMALMVLCLLTIRVWSFETFANAMRHSCLHSGKCVANTKGAFKDQASCLKVCVPRPRNPPPKSDPPKTDTKLTSKVTPPSESKPDPKAKPPMRYSCLHSGDCVANINGAFNSLEACQAANCKPRPRNPTRYKCDGTACIPDPKGKFTTVNCDNKCNPRKVDPPLSYDVSAISGIAQKAGSAFANAAVDAHNKYRERHGAPPVRWDDGLAAGAQAWADNCYFEHARTGYGENLGQGPSLEGTLEQMYNENTLYNYDNPRYSTDTGHFTQIVWNRTDSIGCAVKQCSSITSQDNPKGGRPGNVWVCRYNPAGNNTNPGSMRMNVNRPL